MTLINDSFMRTRLLIGEKGLEKLRAARVAVVGLGAVGSFATEALARAGIGSLTLADFDTVSVTNINRQIYALFSTIGQSKADLAQKRVADINPACQVRLFKTRVRSDVLEDLLSPRPDFVVDAIDSLSEKVALIAGLQERGVAFISSMGAAMRTDPSRIRVCRPDEITHCPLTSAVRRRLKRRGASLNFPCVCSDEPRENLPSPVYENEGDARTVMGSLPSITGIFGLTAANYAIQHLLRA